MLLRKLVGKVFYEKLRARQYLGYWPDLKNPKTFNEKIIQMKLFRIPKSAAVLADKFAVREFIKEKIGEKYLNKLYFSGTSPEDINFDALPQKFVIKMNNGCEWNIIVKDKATLSVPDTIKQLKHFMKQKFGYFTNETWYLDIKPRFIIEEFVETENGEVPDDYKLYCFNGVCKMIQINKDRSSNYNILFYDRDWNALPCGVSHYPYSTVVPKPDNLDAMIDIAQKLSEGFEFVRVDLYSNMGVIKFGEMTFTPTAGWKPINPYAYDVIIGDMW